MKITFDLDRQGNYWQEFLTLEEWQADSRSRYWRENKWKWGQGQETARYEPDRFPCIAIEVASINNSNSYDETVLAYIYDYEKVTE